MFQRETLFLSSTDLCKDRLQRRVVSFSFLIHAELPETPENRLPKGHRISYLVKLFFFPELTPPPNFARDGLVSPLLTSHGDLHAARERLWRGCPFREGRKRSQLTASSSSIQAESVFSSAPKQCQETTGQQGPVSPAQYGTSLCMPLCEASCWAGEGAFSRLPCNLGLPCPISLSETSGPHWEMKASFPAHSAPSPLHLTGATPEGSSAHTTVS